MYRILKDCTQRMEKEVVGFTRELVQTEGVSLHESRVADLIESLMKDAGYHKVIRDEFGNVAGILRGMQSSPVLLLNCHMDTVPPPGGGAGDFSGEMRSGSIYGLGAADCKSGIAAQIYAGIILKRSLLPMKGTLVVAMTSAEENGLSVGLRGFMQSTLPSLALKPDFALMGEPTGMNLYYGHDGWMEVNIQIDGKNPFAVDDMAMRVANDFVSGENLVIRDRGSRCVPAGAGRSGNGVNYGSTLRVACQLREGEDEDGTIVRLRRATEQMARSAGEVSATVAVAERRQRLYTGITRTVKSIAHAWQTDPFDPFVERTREALDACGCPVHPARWRLGRLGLGTAGGVLVHEFSTPTVAYGPGEEEQAHAVGEHVKADDIARTAYGTAAIAQSLIGVPVCGWTSDEI